MTDRPMRRRRWSRNSRRCGTSTSPRPITAKVMRSGTGCWRRPATWCSSPTPIYRRQSRKPTSWLRRWMANGAAAAIGSRALRRELIGVRESILRDYSGRCYNLLVRLFTGLRIHDTQCGFKLFRMDLARRAFEMQRVWGFGFDPELLFLVERTGGKIVEVPVRWNHDAATKVRFPLGSDTDVCGFDQSAGTLDSRSNYSK